MTQVEWSVQAVESLEDLIRTHSLPPETKSRLRESVRPLERYPLLGPAVQARGYDLRFLLGPWRWMIVVYVYLADEDRVVVVSVEDGRSSSAVTARR